eukprot:2054373-Pyramimonas_sp.AAC.1
MPRQCRRPASEARAPVHQLAPRDPVPQVEEMRGGLQPVPPCPEGPGGYDVPRARGSQRRSPPPS